MKYSKTYTNVFLCSLFQALRHLRQISKEVSQPNATGWGRRPAALCALSQKLSKYVFWLIIFISFLSRFPNQGLCAILFNKHVVDREF